MSRFPFHAAPGDRSPTLQVASRLGRPRLWLIGGAGASAVLLASLFGADREAPVRTTTVVTAGRGGYVGDASCVACHQQKAQSYAVTAHAATSRLGLAESIHGRFDSGRNQLRTANPNLYFQMEQRADGGYETAVLRTSLTQVLTRSERIDLVVGSGRKGQTYLYWDDNRLFQLPVSYWTASGAWVNSPGYVDGTAVFERPIAGRCLECHATSFVSTAPPENAYLKSSLVLGIACEKCHGPGAEHVKRYRSSTPPHTPQESAIVNPARLPRDRQIDVCALCHAGIGTPSTAPLSYTPGEVLSDHLTFPRRPPEARIDVHAGQVELLARSRCFQSSPGMTCTTCHDVHRPQRDLAALSQTCTTCHQVEHCGEFRRKGRAIAADCVSCHMPLEQTSQIVIARANGQTFDPSVRNHRIAVYPNPEQP